ncbi:Resolvase, N terminal domain [Desulfacinum hydrothermale DSM 13146]|uniref:Resolvase, N terminal domain n=1 Tax=Desulfacinum hydrothermale DSM 13146 TaxID=1121390 RepID=A0A1W1XP11_9BACT|nr:recombinase family protein [Desulfacinum hydrothermale]SMC25592.1 Resolvase, N terminal domain [Desulfacinum hydrothermale DSM 13146]
MEDKFNAIYLMVRQDELTPEDGGSYERSLAAQKEACLKHLQAALAPEEADTPVEIYTSRRQLFMDVDRQRIKRLVVHDLDRLAATKEELEGILFDLRSAGIPVLTVN